jgi:hypothetical protein
MEPDEYHDLVRDTLKGTVDLNELDALAGEWRSVHNLLMEAAVKAREADYLWELSSTAMLYAAACEAVATRLSNP